MGRLVYLSLDWGLETQVERELSETLEILLCQMTKVNLSLSADHACQPICTISDVIQVLTSTHLQNHTMTELGAVTKAEYAFGLNL